MGWWFNPNRILRVTDSRWTIRLEGKPGTCTGKVHMLTTIDYYRANTYDSRADPRSTEIERAQRLLAKFKENPPSSGWMMTCDIAGCTKNHGPFHIKVERKKPQVHCTIVSC